MKKNYRFLTTFLLAGMGFVQVPQQSVAQSFQNLLQKSRAGATVAATSASNARVAAVLSLHQSSDIYEPDATGTGWVLTGHGRFTYDAQGRETSATMLNTSNQPMYKDSIGFDAQGNEAFNYGYQWQNNAWVMSWGYKNQPTYNAAGKPTEIIHQEWDNGTWKNSWREVNTFNAAGYPTDETTYEWLNNAWQPEGKTVYTFASPAGPPSEIMYQEYFNGSWRGREKIINLTWHNFENFQPITWEQQERDSFNNWISTNKGSVIYDAFGGSVGVEQVMDVNGWVNYEKGTETYDTRMNFTGYKGDTWQNNAWVLEYEEAQVLTYNPLDQITERIFRGWDQTSSSLVNERKEVYSNFRVLGTGKTLAPLQVKVYPNPAIEFVRVQIPGTEAASAILTDLTGRVVLNQVLPAGAMQQLNLSGLAKGTYLLKLETSKGLSLQKIVKQ